MQDRTHIPIPALPGLSPALAGGGIIQRSSIFKGAAGSLQRRGSLPVPPDQWWGASVDRAKPDFSGSPRPNGLAAAMRMAGIDTATLARETGVNPGDIEAWACGQRELRPAMATRLSVHLHTTAADLLIGLGCGEPPLPTRLHRSDEAGVERPRRTHRTGDGSLAETALMLSAAALMGVVGWLVLLD